MLTIDRFDLMMEIVSKYAHVVSMNFWYNVLAFPMAVKLSH